MHSEDRLGVCLHFTAGNASSHAELCADTVADIGRGSISNVQGSLNVKGAQKIGAVGLKNVNKSQKTKVIEMTGGKRLASNFTRVSTGSIESSVL